MAITPVPGTYIGEASADGGRLTFVRWALPQGRNRTLLYTIRDSTIHLPFMGNPRDAIRRAAAKWDSVLAPRLRLLEIKDGNLDSADIVVEITRANLLKLGGGGYQLGYTELDYIPGSPTQDLAHVHIGIRQYITPLLNGTSTEAVALHEFGHALGIRGHIRAREDGGIGDSIMTARVPRKAELTARDKATLRHLYRAGE